MAQPLINGRAFDFVDIQISILGGELNGVTEVSWTSEQEKVNNMGVGNFPVSRGRGPQNTSGSIGLSMNEVEALREIAPLGNLLQLATFDIVVVFGNVQSPQTHEIKNVEFTTDGVAATQGDTDLIMVLDFVASHVVTR